MIRFSSANYLDTVTPVASTADPEYPVTNLKTPQRPGLLWKATVATDTNVVFNHGSNKSLANALIVNANFTSARIQANGSDAWGSPSYNVLVTLTRSANGRYQHLHVPTTPPNLQFTRLFIPTQTPTDGTSAFSCGGLHLGLNEAPLEDVLVDYDIEVVEPWIKVAPPHGAWQQRSRVGLNFVRLALRRLSRVNLTPTTGIGDDLAAWIELERLWSDKDFVMVGLTQNPAWAWIMRRDAGPKWELATHIARAELALEEVT